ncbi:MAG: DegT/DnrJ/EryC1/StrS family aminotransferase [Fimbriimonadaceae bacterium]|nr:DegT/DnrJ/EryC1/StrS family aminotransferase [Fimbriimonadaceae bacterium]
MVKLAVDGGTAVRTTPWPARRLFGEAERAAALALFDQAIGSGQAFGYNGAPEEQYRQQFAAFLGGGQAHTVNSGTSAVLAAVAGCALPPFSEVVVPPITDPGGVMPVALLNLIPVVADAVPGSYNVGAASLEAALTARTSAVLVAHIAGDPVEMGPVVELCRQRGLKLIEDCAQAHGATCDGKLVGTFGDIAAFSTMSGKHHATGAQGGVVWSADEQTFWRARRFADRGKPFGTTATTNVEAGLNLNLNDLSAAIGLPQLAKLPSIIDRRRAVADAIVAGLKQIPGVRPGWIPAGARSAHWFLRVEVDPVAIRVPMGDFVKAVSAEGIPVGWPYTVITSDAEWFRSQIVFGTPGLPWSAPQYSGPRHPEYALPQARLNRDRQFNVYLHEACSQDEASDVVAAISKVAQAYRA